MAKEKQGRIIQEFDRRRKRQLLAIGVTVFLLFSLVWKLKHPGVLLGELSPSLVTLLEIVLIAVFIAFSITNWRCPSCGRSLGPDINVRSCRNCRVRLQ